MGNEVVGRQLLRIEPEAHTVIALAKVRHVADAGQTRQFIAKLNSGEIAQIKIVAAIVGRIKVDNLEDVRRFFLDGDAAAFHEVGQDRLGERFAVLHQDLRDIEVGAGLECHGERVIAVVGALRRHVHHVFDAVDLLLNRRRHGVGDDAGVGAGIDADTSTVGGAISGYCATGSVNRAMPPPSVMKMDSTAAKMGRLMKKRENTIVALFQSLGAFRGVLNALSVAVGVRRSIVAVQRGDQATTAHSSARQAAPTSTGRRSVNTPTEQANTTA